MKRKDILARQRDFLKTAVVDMNDSIYKTSAVRRGKVTTTARISFNDATNEAVYGRINRHGEFEQTKGRTISAEEYAKLSTAVKQVFRERHKENYNRFAIEMDERYIQTMTSLVRHADDVVGRDDLSYYKKAVIGYQTAMADEISEKMNRRDFIRGNTKEAISEELTSMFEEIVDASPFEGMTKKELAKMTKTQLSEYMVQNFIGVNKAGELYYYYSAEGSEGNGTKAKNYRGNR